MICACGLILVCLIKCGMWAKAKVGGEGNKLILIGCGKSAIEFHCVDRKRGGLWMKVTQNYVE